MRTAGDYDPTVTELCERALVTIIGNAGFWGRHLFLVGGLAPRYLTVSDATPLEPHIGTHDVDLAIVLAIDAKNAGDYETLDRNLRDSGFTQAPQSGDPEFRWRREVEGVPVVLEFLCETDEAPHGRNFKPRSGAGSRFQAFNVRGLGLVAADHRSVEVTAERLDDGGKATTTVRVAGVLSFVALKISAYQDRHAPKDTYDLVYVLLHHEGGPAGAGRAMAESPVFADAFAVEAIALLRERFADPANDAPSSYATFLAVSADREEGARLRNEAVAVVAEALAAFDTGRASAE